LVRHHVAPTCFGIFIFGAVDRFKTYHYRVEPREAQSWRGFFYYYIYISIFIYILLFL